MLFIGAFILVLACFIFSLINTNAYNSVRHYKTLSGKELFTDSNTHKDEEGALYHHERYDGKGYPEGKAGEEIPLIARMICVADSFDAMNTNRVYREKLTREMIISELEDNKGKQFDPQIADIMLRLIKEGRVVIN